MTNFEYAMRKLMIKQISKELGCFECPFKEECEKIPIQNGVCFQTWNEYGNEEYKGDLEK